MVPTTTRGQNETHMSNNNLMKPLHVTELYHRVHTHSDMRLAGLYE